MNHLTKAAPRKIDCPLSGEGCRERCSIFSYFFYRLSKFRPSRSYRRSLTFYSPSLDLRRAEGNLLAWAAKEHLRESSSQILEYYSHKKNNPHLPKVLIVPLFNLPHSAGSVFDFNRIPTIGHRSRQQGDGDTRGYDSFIALATKSCLLIFSLF